MRKAVLLFAVAAVACSGTTKGSSTTSSAPQPFVAPSTTEYIQAVEIEDCQSPPVTFSNLCEIYELLDRWHVDRPLDPEALAAVALEGLESYETNDTEEPPRTLFCAIPDPAFSGLCDSIAQGMTVSQMPPQPAVEAAVTRMVEFGLDPFTFYVPPDQASSFRLNGIVGGIGVLLDARDAVGSKCARVGEACPLTVVTVLDDNPAHGAGLQSGDIITHIDGEPVEGFGFTSAVALIAGDETGSVTLEVERNGEMVQFTIQRSALVFPTVEVAVPAPRTAYVRIPDFDADIALLVHNGLTEIDGLYDTLIIDLRDNPGGLVTSVIDVAGLFIDGGTVMTTEEPDESIQHVAAEGGLATSQSLVVLVNAGTASAAEVLAGALRDRREAVVVGVPTFGKDTVQIPFELRNGGQLLVAVARWSTPNGDTVVNGGLVPDYLVEWPEGLTVEEVVSLALTSAS